MAVAQDTIESKLIENIKNKINKSQAVTMKILETIGDTKEIADFYGLRFNKSVRAYQGRNNGADLFYSGGSEKDHINNIALFQKINGMVLGYIAEGASYLDKQEIPGFLKEEIIKLAES